MHKFDHITQRAIEARISPFLLFQVEIGILQARIECLKSSTHDPDMAARLIVRDINTINEMRAYCQEIKQYF